MKIRPTSHAKQEIDLRLDPSLETARAASIILSAAYAEYDRAKITTGAMTFPLRSYRRGPPDGTYTWSILHVEAASDSTVTVQVHGRCNRSTAVTMPTASSARTSRACAENKRTPDPADAPGEGPGRSITRCFDSVEVRALPHAPFGETASLLRAIVGRARGAEAHRRHRASPRGLRAEDEGHAAFTVGRPIDVRARRG